MTDRPADSFLELGDRLERGEPLERILLDRIGPEWREVLRHCSVVPDFTQDLYGAVLCPAPGGPTVAELLDHGLLEHTARPGHYRIAELLRFACWDSWWHDSPVPATTAPEPLRNLAVRLAGAYAAAEDEPGRLRLLAIAGDLDADAFRTAFDAADRRFDLARCQDLVNAVSDPQVTPLLRPDLGRTVAEAAARARARALWRPAYHQSAGYFPRPRVEEPLRTLLTSDDRRPLRIHATGGSGKSMLLRWFMARHCQDRPVPVPCAYLDFDHTDPALAVTHPWLLVLEAAEQLNGQLLESPFDAFLATYRKELAALPRNRSRAADAFLSVQIVGRRTAVVADFAAVLSETLDRQATRAVLVLDTLEEVLLRDGARLGELTAMLNGLAGRVHGLRIVLSGRYDLGDALPLPARVLRLDPFDEEESDAYLRDVRAVGEPELRRAMSESSAGLPYTLALFADLAEDLTPEQIRSASGPGLLYAIDRVLERVHDDRLRWLLRYGVIPRRLSLRIVREVMLPHLRDGIRGTGTADDPSRDDRPVMRLQIFQPAFPGFTDGAAELPDLWAALTRYAGDSVWVGRDPADPEVLVIDRTVRDPLRALLADHTVSKLLNRDLAEHFARRASEAESPPEWVRWTVEEFYHRFAEDQENGAEAWARLIGEPRFDAPDPSLADLARRIIELNRTGESTVPPTALARAALLAYRERTGNGSGFSEEELTVLDLGTAGIELGDPEVRRAIELTGARMMLRRGSPSDARPRLDAVAPELDLAAPVVVAEYHRITGALALAEGRGDEAQDAFEHADRVLSPDGGELTAGTLADVVSLLDAGWVGHAARWLPRLSARAAPRLYLRLLLATGRPAEALELAVRFLHEPDVRELPLEQATLAALRLHRPGAVLALTAEWGGEWPEGSEPRELWVDVQMTRAAALALLHAPVAAVTRLTSLVLARMSPSPETLLLLARVAQLLDTAGGSKAEVDRLLSQVEQLADSRRNQVVLHAPPEVLAELVWWPEPLWPELTVPGADRRADAPPPVRVVWLLGALARANPGTDEELTGELVDALGPLGSPEARLVALERLHRVRRRLQVSRGTADRLTELCTPDVWWTETPDAAALGLTFAELLRVLGRTREAADLAHVCAEPLARAEPAVWLPYLARTAPEDRGPARLPEDLADVLAGYYGEFPEAAAAVLTDRALHALEEGREADARHLAPRAWSLVEDRPASLTRARCVGVTATVAVWAGQPQAEVRVLADLAHELYRELGREPESRYVPEYLCAGAAEPAVSWRESVLRIDGDPLTSRPAGHLSFQLFESTGPESRSRLAQSHGVPSDWTGGLDALQAALSGSAAEWAREAGVLLGAVLPDRTGQVAADEPAPTDLRLEAALGQQPLLAAPWEAATEDGVLPVLRPDREYVYRALVDHPAEAAALRRLRALEQDTTSSSPSTDLREFALNLWRSPHQQVRVGVLARRRSRDSSEHTGGRSALPPVLPLYENHRSVRMVDPTRRVDRRGVPQLLHIQGSFHKEASEPSVGWDTRGKSSAAGLGEYLGTRTGPNPLVVLEAMHPGSHHEAMRQLLLRNLFAADLLACGRVSAVLAIGPFLRPTPDSERARRQFVESLVTGAHPADAVRGLTQALLQQPGPPSIALPALFSAVPTDLLVPLWAEVR
ncbi:hypothetical protein [Kitasatospora purpeofusca]|uniref:hypothetical protein n=1 Tax=Kitasatospora purpeofusca TaxID=67352 RepID=UPI002A59A2F1|nr:hypothetical protein [Kitasatospora purpeofusca]MDY0813333.1 hypothetical protein [Kitasatospora purpeofusca]